MKKVLVFDGIHHQNLPQPILSQKQAQGQNGSPQESRTAKL
jgi:hypothetical protein